MIRNIRCTNGAEENRIKSFYLLQTICGHHAPGAAIVIAAPIEILEAQREAAILFSQRLQNMAACLDNIRPDAIATHGGNSISLHGQSFPFTGASGANPCRARSRRLQSHQDQFRRKDWPCSGGKQAQVLPVCAKVQADGAIPQAARCDHQRAD